MSSRCEHGVTIAGRHGHGDAANQLSFVRGLYLDEQGVVILADCLNHRIVEWKRDAMNGAVVAGGNGQGHRPNQLNYPTDVIAEQATNTLIICDRDNRRVDPVGLVRVGHNAEKRSSITSLATD